jgi:hypothetical protein
MKSVLMAPGKMATPVAFLSSDDGILSFLMAVTSLRTLAALPMFFGVSLAMAAGIDIQKKSAAVAEITKCRILLIGFS